MWSQYRVIERFKEKKSAASGMRISTRLILVLILFSCTVSNVRGQAPYFPGEDWRTSTPEAQGLSTSKLEDMMTFIDENYLKIEGVVVIRNGYLVFERYPSPEFDAETRHFLFSVTKSFTSALVGIAINEGIIQDTSQTMVGFFPDREIVDPDGRKSTVTVENLLMMRSGMKWDETSAGYNTPENDIYHINHGDGLQYCLNLPMIADPDTLWHYNTGSSHILSGIIAETSGTTTLEFAKTHLFEPMEVTNFLWSMDLGSTNKGGFDLQLTPRDMARFGYLYLNEGMWGDTQIVPKEWVELSTSTHTSLDEETGYGYQWWTMPRLNAFKASGLYGQQIFVVPDEEIVFVLTAHISPSQHTLKESFLEDYILASIIEESDTGQDDTGILGYPVYALVAGLLIYISINRVLRNL